LTFVQCEGLTWIFLAPPKNKIYYYRRDVLVTELFEVVLDTLGRELLADLEVVTVGSFRRADTYMLSGDT
jgi:hypothetical protein